MRCSLYTLVDITRTDARRGDDPYEYKQQQNYLTVIQTASLRANAIVNNQPIVSEIETDKLDFGNNIKGIQKVWQLDFEYENEFPLEDLINDFDLVPIITDLEETNDFTVSAFLTNGSADRNTFVIKDK